MINIYVLHTGRMRAAQRHINIYTHTFCSHPPPFFSREVPHRYFLKTTTKRTTRMWRENRLLAPWSSVETQKQARGSYTHVQKLIPFS